jgi:hypothetical protein
MADQALLNKHEQLTVYQQLKRESILALPSGTLAIKGLEGAIIQQTELGTVKLTEAPEFINYQVFYSAINTGSTLKHDLKVPIQHQAWIDVIKQQLNLENQSKQRIAEKIQHYFKTHYFYTLFLGTESDADIALQNFILKSKAGHCEYFAVASVFLLRSYGIPARLVNGYAMQEYDETGQMYFVRRRHAHAWAIANIDGSWQAVDATPSQWLDVEEDNAALLQPLYDWFSAIYFKYKQWQYQNVLAGNDEAENQLWIMVVVLLSAYIILRLYSGRRQMIKKAKADVNLSS